MTHCFYRVSSNRASTYLKQQEKYIKQYIHTHKHFGTENYKIITLPSTLTQLHITRVICRANKILKALHRQHNTKITVTLPLKRKNRVNERQMGNKTLIRHTKCRSRKVKSTNNLQKKKIN